MSIRTLHFNQRGAEYTPASDESVEEAVWHALSLSRGQRAPVALHMEGDINLTVRPEETAIDIVARYLDEVGRLVTTCGGRVSHMFTSAAYRRGMQARQHAMDETTGRELDALLDGKDLHGITGWIRKYAHLADEGYIDDHESGVAARLRAAGFSSHDCVGMVDKNAPEAVKIKYAAGLLLACLERHHAPHQSVLHFIEALFPDQKKRPPGKTARYGMAA